MFFRLQQLLDQINLTPSRFAQLIGVQRSAVSHVLSGRNNPSLEFLRKIIENFPEVDSEWLITGEGNILKENLTQSLNPLNIKQKNIFDEFEEEKDEEDIIEVKDDKVKDEVKIENINIEETNIKDKKQEIIIEVDNTLNIEKETISNNKTQEIIKKTTIERIVVLQVDGTFKDYLPERVG